MGHVNIIVCEADYKGLKRGIENLPPAGRFGTNGPVPLAPAL
jgi:hypothetical protein